MKPGLNAVIASASEAIHRRQEASWIASSLSLLAMKSQGCAKQSIIEASISRQRQ
jgi:hypothetical protein